MEYQLPHYILQASLNNPVIDYFWDDTNIDQKLDYNYASAFITKLEPCTLRAKIGLSIGAFEWVLGRFYQLNDKAVFYQLAQAAWCANIDKRYLKYIELDNREYRGSVDYALWLAYAALFPVLLVSENISDPKDKDNYVDPLFMYDKEGWQDSLSTLLAIVKYILPNDKLPLLESWLNQVIDRFVIFYTAQKEDPFANIFGHKDDKEWLGDYVAREVLDLDYPYDPQDAVTLCDQFLQQVDYRNNPLLVPPEQLTGKIEHPYRLVE